MTALRGRRRSDCDLVLIPPTKPCKWQIRLFDLHAFRRGAGGQLRPLLGFSRLGVTTSDAMNRLLADTLSRGTIPAPASGIAAESDGNEIPNKETRQLLERLEAGTEPLYGPFNSVEEMFAALDAMPDE